MAYDVLQNVFFRNIADARGIAMEANLEIPEVLQARRDNDMT